MNCLHLAGRKELPQEDRLNYQAMAQAELERLMHTVQRMLDYYRPAALDHKPVKINELVNRVQSLIGPQLTERSILIQSHLAQDLPDIWAVADQIQQVLLNLIRNAVEAMQDLPHGRLTIRAIRREPGFIEVVVSDSGPGLAPEIAATLFAPFQSTKAAGMGVGLSISRTIIEAHEGRIWADSSPYGGASFHFTLPDAAGEGAVA
jgi:two-component system sensor kinase FixL